MRKNTPASDQAFGLALLNHADPWHWLAQADDADIPLFEASILIALDEYPSLDVQAVRAKFDALVAQASDLASHVQQPLDRLKSLNQFLFDTQGFSGNFLDYYNPRNSYLNDVLDRKLGIPISLAVLYVEIGRSLGVDLAGVSFPGHFLVRLPVDGGLIIIDPFNRGKSIGSAELKYRASSNGGHEELSEDELFQLLAPCENKAVLVRMLYNLKTLYQNSNDHERALRVVHRLVQLTNAPQERRDRGMLYLAIGALHAARVDLAAYLASHPNASDEHEVRIALMQAQQGPRIN
jgi:regulator of sirC expression with transglutaminase-like and TPR domain